MRAGGQMTPEEIQSALIEGQSLNRRDPGLVRAELVDALHDYAEIFREKGEMENQRADAIDVVAAKVAAGGSAEAPDIAQSASFEHKQQLAYMRFQELQMRVNRLVMEHGNG